MSEEPMTDDQVRGLLHREYPKLFPQEIDRIAKTCRSEKWFLQLVKSKRLSEDLPGPGPVMAEDETPATDETKYGSTKDKHPDDPDPETMKPDRDRDIRAAEWALKLLLSARTDGVRHMRASIGLAILKNNLNLGEIADHFKVTPERVRQVVKDVKGYEISD